MNPICKITKLEHPPTMPLDGDLQIGLEYENIGEAGPTFYRARTPGTWDFKLMSDTPNHTPGDLATAHVYHAVPEGHLILQVEVGHGTWLNPIKITDTQMIIILHPDYPPPDPSTTLILVDIATPPTMWPVVKRFWAAPGSTIMASWIYDNREGLHEWAVKYARQQNCDPSVVPLDWVVNGEPWPDPKTIHNILPGTTHVLEVKAEIPEAFEPKFITFMVLPVNPTIVQP